MLEQRADQPAFLCAQKPSCFLLGPTQSACPCKHSALTENFRAQCAPSITNPYNLDNELRHDVFPNKFVLISPKLLMSLYNAKTVSVTLEKPEFKKRGKLNLVHS